MNLTLDQEEKLHHLMEEIAASRSKLNKWEAGFFEDQEKRYAEHGSQIFLSPKQWAVLNSLYEKVTE